MGNITTRYVRDVYEKTRAFRNYFTFGRPRAILILVHVHRTTLLYIYVYYLS